MEKTVVQNNSCKVCGVRLSWGRFYCSHSCRASVTNKQRTIKRNPDWHHPQKQCPECDATFYGPGIFCDMNCKRKHQDADTNSRFEQGLITERRTLRKLLTNKYGKCCSNCYISSWQGVELSLELDHIDGNASNNFPTNVRLLCPNCHSITSLWKGRNRGKGRKSRNLPLH